VSNRFVEPFVGCECEYREADIVVFGAPFDGTTSYRPGTRFAPKAIRAESFGIETYSPYQDKDLNDFRVCDYGDLELPFGNTDRALTIIQEFEAQIFSDGKTPVMIGGEHLVTLGAVREASKRFDKLHIIHFDAHADLRDTYIGEKLSHATVMRRVCEIVGYNKIYQFGIRSGDREEFEFAANHTVMQKFSFEGLKSAVKQIEDKPVYLSVDLDVLDPSIFMGTGTPEAGGVSFDELLEALFDTAKLNIVGCDINELCPVYDPSGVSTAAACKVVRELLIMLGGG
jgi:agmatinase